MIYLTQFLFPDEAMETNFLWNVGNTCAYYPFRVLSAHGLERIDFEPITILYGGNGSGKSTALNVIADKTEAARESIYNQSAFYPDYVKMCRMPMLDKLPENSKMITSDDVFDYMLNIRCLNEGIREKRKDVMKEYLDAKYSQFQMKSMADYDRLKKVNQARSKTQSKFVRSEVMEQVHEYSNGESAFRYFIEKIDGEGFYILDEPENSLDPKHQLDLKSFIEDSARFFGCQFLISTHSPFLLSMKGAKIYNLDEKPAAVRKWTELENVRIYYDFFQTNRGDFSEF